MHPIPAYAPGRYDSRRRPRAICRHSSRLHHRGCRTSRRRLIPYPSHSCRNGCRCPSVAPAAATEPFVPTLGALTGNRAVQQVKAGLKAIYLSGLAGRRGRQYRGSDGIRINHYSSRSMPCPTSCAGSTTPLRRCRSDFPERGRQGRNLLDGADHRRRGSRFRWRIERL